MRLGTGRSKRGTLRRVKPLPPSAALDPRVGNALHSPALLPTSLSTDAHRIDALLSHSLAASLALFATALFALLFLTLRAVRRARSEALTPGFERALALVAAGLSAVMLFGVDLPVIARAERDLRTALWAFPRGGDVVRVEVLAHRWSWSFRHAGLDGAFGTPDDVVTLNTLHVPAGAPVVLSLTASDVVHGFFAPSLRVEQDAIPGRVTHLWFRATAPRAVEILCAQYCGWAHPTMRATLVAQRPDDFTRWHSERSREALRTHVTPSRGDWAWPWRSP